MANEKVLEAPDPVDPGAQALAILDALGAWLTASPGRAVVFRHSPTDGFRTTLEEARSAGGVSLADAAAQIATAATLDVVP